MPKLRKTFLPHILRPIPKMKRIELVEGEDTQFIAGRHSRIYEAFKVLRIAIEFIRGFQKLHWIPPAVTVFGSARFQEGHPHYELGRQVGAHLARMGFAVMTGGGPGIMEAANRGAQEAGGTSVGCNIILPHENAQNRFLDRCVTFYYFFVRKVMLIKYSSAYIILPGGIGTLDELTEALTLIQTGKLYDFPVILMGREYWTPFLEWIETTLVTQGAIRREELKMLTLTDHLSEVEILLTSHASRIGIKLERRQTA